MQTQIILTSVMLWLNASCTNVRCVNPVMIPFLVFGQCLQKYTVNIAWIFLVT